MLQGQAFGALRALQVAEERAREGRSAQEELPMHEPADERLEDLGHLDIEAILPMCWEAFSCDEKQT